MAVKALASVTVSNVADGADGRMLYATCPTAAATAAKVATVSSGTVALYAGLTVAVQFMYTNTASSPTLNVNGTGAKAIYVNGRAITAASYWVAGATLTFVYDGARWVQADADNVGNVDGRNYIANSATLVGDSLGSTAGSRKEYLTLDVGDLYSGLENGTQVTVSFDLVMQVNTVGGSDPSLRVYNSNLKGPMSIRDAILGFPDASVGDTIEGRYSVTTSLSRSSAATLSTNYIEFYSNYGTSNWFRVSKLKLEVGGRATAWSPAPEDVTSGIDSAQNTANAGIKEQVTLFYAAASATTPSKPTANVTTSNATTYAAWNRTLPTYRSANQYLYVCTQSLTSGGTYSWSAVEPGSYADWAAALGTRLTTAETQISQNTADIALKASQTEVSSLGTRVSTAEASIDANKAAIALKVSQAQFDAMQVGGTNIYLGDIADRGVSSNNPSAYPTSDSKMADEPMSMAYRHVVRSGAGTDNATISIYNSPALSVLSEPLVAGQTYTASCLVRTNCTCANSGTNWTFGYLYSPTLGLLDKVYGPAIQGTGEWERWRMTFTVPEYAGQTGFRILPYWFTFGPGVTWETAYVDLARYKIERGNRATDWSPAPEDVQSGIDTAQTAADAGIKEQVTLFYAAASATAPSKPTANVTTSSATTYAAWNRTLPTYRSANPYLYVCTQSLTSGGTYSWSAVEPGSYADWAAALGTRLTTAETQISQNTADIALKASQTEVSSLGTRVSTAEASIDANKAQIALKVSQAQFDAMQVGGTNLCPGSNVAGTGGWISNSGTSLTVENVDVLGQNCIHAVLPSNDTGRIPSLTMAYTDWMTLELGTEYTLSAEIMLPDGGNSVPNNTAPLHYHCFFSGTENPTDSVPSVDYAAFKSVRIVEGNTAWVAGEWKRITIRYVTKDAPVDDEHPYIKYRPYIYGTDSANPTELYLRNYKFEKGNVPTAWSPAPEDVAADATSKADKALADAKSYTDAQINVQADRITGTVTDVDGLKARTSTLEQTASGLTVSVSKAQGDATQALADAADANANADGVAERADAALRDAQSGINDSIDALSSALTFGLDGLTSSINTVGEDLKNVTTMVRVTQRDQKPLLTLGASNSDAGVDLTNESLEFRVGAQVLASASGSAFSMPVAAVGQSISLGGYMLVAKQGGGFSVKWTGV